jgi:hypothetical protein
LTLADRGDAETDGKTGTWSRREQPVCLRVDAPATAIERIRSRREPLLDMVNTLLRCARRVALATAFGYVLLGSRAARADGSGRDAVVVVVTPGATLDAKRLRGAIGVELGVDAVAPGDPRAAAARGTLTVTERPDATRLTLSYLAKSEAVERTVDLPADPEAAQRAAVALAGNVARDEASELAADLRRGQPASATPAPAAPPPSRAAAGTESVEIDPAAFQATLDYYAEQDRLQRVTVGWTALGLGAVGVASGVLLVSDAPAGWGPANSARVLTITFGGSFILGGAAALTGTTRLAQLAEYDREGGGAVRTAAAWTRAARAERSTRRTLGTILAVAGGAALAYGAFVASDDRWITDPGSRSTTAASFLAVGAIYGVLGVAAVTCDGPLESSLHAYEASQGVRPWHLVVDDVAIAPVRGGAAATVRVVF